MRRGSCAYFGGGGRSWSATGLPGCAQSFCSFSRFYIKVKKLLNDGVRFSWYKDREKEYLPFFINESRLVYCVDVKWLIKKLGTAYNPLDWRLFIDSSKASLKAVLLHDGNLFASIPLAHSA